MKSNRKSRISTLTVDVVEYMFIEWLVRHALFSVYKADFEKFSTNHLSFRDGLRVKLRSLCRSSVFGVEDVISTSFPFVMTPEGYNFWLEKSNLWRSFCDAFKSTF